MKYEHVIEGNFIERLNRFAADVQIGGEKEKVHVKNTGRCRELLVPGAKVYLEDFSERMGSRKLKYSLIGVEKAVGTERRLINMDSQAPNQVVREALESGRLIPEGLKDAAFVKSEYVYGNSRIDFYVKDSTGKEALMEVKGVTLEQDGVAEFPDAPTERGIKHIRELVKAREEGYCASILFVLQMKGVDFFQPNDRTHPAFGAALREAVQSGVTVCAYDCIVGTDTLTLDRAVDIKL